MQIYSNIPEAKWRIHVVTDVHKRFKEVVVTINWLNDLAMEDPVPNFKNVLNKFKYAGTDVRYKLSKWRHLVEIGL